MMAGSVSAPVQEEEGMSRTKEGYCGRDGVVEKVLVVGKVPFRVDRARHHLQGCMRFGADLLESPL